MWVLHLLSNLSFPLHVHCDFESNFDIRLTDRHKFDRNLMLHFDNGTMHLSVPGGDQADKVM